MRHTAQPPWEVPGEPEEAEEAEEGTPIILAFRDKYGRQWTAAAIAGPARLEGARHEAESIDYSLESVQDLGMILQAFRVVTDG